MPVRVSFSKYTVFEICRQKCAVFMATGELSVTFFTVFQNVPAQQRVNAVLKSKHVPDESEKNLKCYCSLNMKANIFFNI